jgi:hypothetical protein
MGLLFENAGNLYVVTPGMFACTFLWNIYNLQWIQLNLLQVG